jgi:hypothetical protein
VVAGNEGQRRRAVCPSCFLPNKENEMEDAARRFRLVIDVAYAMSEDTDEELKRVLHRAAEHLADMGLLSGESGAEVVEWEAAPYAVPDMRTASSCSLATLAEYYRMNDLVPEMALFCLPVTGGEYRLPEGSAVALRPVMGAHSVSLADPGGLAVGAVALLVQGDNL